MANDTMLGGLYVLMAAMLVLGLLMSHRGPFARALTAAIGWMAIFAAGFVLFTFRDNIGWVSQRLKSEATGDPVVAGREIRIPMAVDGHFWVDAKLNGHDVKFLVDSGATMTTIDRSTARSAGVTVSERRNQRVRTGNGIILVAGATVSRLTLGPLERRDTRVQVADGDSLNVLGMNFLSSLQRWGVEGRWLVLVP